MNEAIITSTKIPRRLRVTKILLYLLLIFIIWKISAEIASAGYYMMSPESSVKVINTDYGTFHIEGYGGYINISFDDLAVRAEDLPVANTQLFAASLLLLLVITHELPMLLILIQASRLLREITTSYTPFTEKTTKLIRSIGIIMLLKGFLGKLILQMGINLINFHHRWCDNPFDFTWILIGLFVLILADVFYKGCLLQQDADETL